MERAARTRGSLSLEGGFAEGGFARGDFAEVVVGVGVGIAGRRRNDGIVRRCPPPILLLPMLAVAAEGDIMALARGGAAAKAIAGGARDRRRGKTKERNEGESFSLLPSPSLKKKKKKSAPTPHKPFPSGSEPLPSSNLFFSSRFLLAASLPRGA